jgi:hypothetical protein
MKKYGEIGLVKNKQLICLSCEKVVRKNVDQIYPRWQHGSQMCVFNFNLVKNYKIAKNSTTTEAREKISTDLESFNFLCMSDKI